MNQRRNADVLTSLIDLEGKKVADIGCGDGSLTRMMTRHGATVIGVECAPAQLERARSAKPAGNEVYSEGVGEDMSFEDNKLDLVVFFNSLHHIDVKNQDKALAEAARVLKPGGMVYICEPIAAGEHFTVMKPAHDETKVRAAAYRAIKKAEKIGLTPEQEIEYEHTATYPDFEAFCQRLLNVNPNLESGLEKLQGKLKKNFDTLGHVTEEGIQFAQPMRVNLLIKNG